MIYFISGHGNLSAEDFVEYYVPGINHALITDPDPRFVIGDYVGADTLAQLYLLNRVQRTRVTVYHMFLKPRINLGDYNTDGGYQSDDERDTAMTEASDVDIAWVRPGFKTSGTQANINRRKKQLVQALPPPPAS